MSEYKHGEMDTAAQEAAFNGFITWVKNGAIACIVILILLAIFGG